MITAIEIENFKAIGERVRVELKPLTLLFGPNSAGKSTIVQAIHYAREILVRSSIDPDRTESGGKSVDLGGFRQFVHDHDDSKGLLRNNIYNQVPVAGHRV
jgi:AAA15 family ATPase/GTPase